jgi:hypothetical protein
MKKRKFLKSGAIISLVACVLSGCSRYLDLKPDDSFSIPSSLQDLRGLLGNSEVVMNFATTGLGETACDSYYLNETSWAGMTNERDRLLYLWQPYSPVASQWTGPYQAILYANTVLKYLPSIKMATSDEAEVNTLRGAALFYRAHQLFNLLQVFSLPYDPSGSNAQLGVVLRTEPSLDEQISRSTVRQCYDFIITDLKTSIGLLPDRTDIPTRPSKAASYAELARIYLVMSEFETAGRYADSALMIRSEVMDYGTEITATASLPFSKWNKEVIFDVAMNGGVALAPSRRRVNMLEYDNYEKGDLRKVAFFSLNNLGEILFKGNYNGLNSSQLFCGTTTAEMYLIRAEANIRQNRLNDAAKDIDLVRAGRFSTDDFKPVVFTDQRRALEYIKKERQRELIFRGQRWSDIRRYILLGEQVETMTRTAEGKTYTMKPSDVVRYLYKLPDEVIDNGSLTQN